MGSGKKTLKFEILPRGSITERLLKQNESKKLEIINKFKICVNFIHLIYLSLLYFNCKMDMKVHVNANDIKKDADGFEDIDAFWESAEPGV